MTEHPWASRAPIAWLLANELGATAVVGFLLTAGVALPPILPVMLAGASAVATRSARRLAVDPLADAMTGIRRDLAPFLVLTLAVALVAAVPAWLALAIRGDDGLNAGFRLALVALPALTAAPLLFGAVIASATQTRALMVPAAGLTLALSSVRTSIAVAALIAVALVPIASPAGPAILPITLGLGFRLAVALAWRSIERSGQLPS
jgi:hypothetical protein